MSDKWIIEESRTLVSDQWIKLRADRCRRKDGLIIEPYYVLEQAEWISVLPLTADQQVVMVKEYRHGANVIQPALVGGRVDASDASPEAAALRELLEETGYAPKQMINLGDCFANWANQNNKVHMFLALDCMRIEDQKLDESEQIEVMTMPLAKISEPGFLRQSFNIVNLHLALPHLPKATN
ncbi:MAG: NUDIX hydrolase [Rhizobiaceae bacterium]|nr:NUDIX hydrolase [Rhizobiaceae bacterium]